MLLLWINLNLSTKAKLRQHYQSKKNQCSPPPEISSQKEGQKKANIPRPRSLSPAPIVHTWGRDRRMEKPKAIPPTPEPELAPPSGQNQGDKYIDRHARKSGEHLRTWGARLRQRCTVTGEECNLPLTIKDCQRLHHELLQADDESFENVHASTPSTKPEQHPTQQNGHQCQAEDPEAGPGPATQANRKKERKIVVPITAVVDIHFEECPVVPHPEENPAYAFNVPVFGHEYAEAPYIPQLISAFRAKIKEVLQTELHRKDQIKSAIVVKCLYLLTKKDKEEREDSEDFANKVYKVKYHRGTGGSHKPTPKKLANTKSTINPDNQGLIDPETNRPSEKCLQGALGCYFAHQDKPDTDHLERIFQAKNLKPYLEKVKLDGIPMPTPICSRIFDKIEEMNPDISISVWEWKEETATLKPVIASKNFKRQHKIQLLAFTDITKSEDDKYGQKNHFLWIKNSSRLIYGDSAHKEKKIHENAPQRVTMPVKGVNDFEEFKNYGQMINAPCVIIADFEADNKKCDEAYGGSMRKLAEQKANSFCYLVHWIDTEDVWSPFLYRGENATQEFVRRIDQELVKINEVLAIKHERIETEEDKKRYADDISCWICKSKFDIDTDEIEHLEAKITYLKEKLKSFKKVTAEYNGIQTIIEKATKAIASEKAKANKVWNHCHITANAQHIRVIAETFERYKSMKVGQLKYIDSMQFMNSSLASLTKNLGNNHPITSQYFKKLCYTEEQLALVYYKGVNPYDYIDSHDRFKETELPPIHEFHSTLKGKIS
ncbi:uncharacterized protein OCT59_014362 [Rhizophagus irregularis]|uniref:uncharacterized protein n=1 Tax=Rhizophagus irregularis TaxID=588596 RepID=UPI003333F2C5|nr:hypothetical protein OCT59_014362 [Rhizophagus irregularis]